MTETSSTKHTPTHELYVVIGTGKTANWTRIGAAWPHRDDAGFNLSLSALPHQGRLVMRAVKADEEGARP